MRAPVPSRDMAIVGPDGKLTPHGYDLLKRLSDAATAASASAAMQDATLADHEARLLAGGL